MTLNLDRLPYDVLFNIGGRLSFLDAVHLTLTSRQLYSLRSERTFCRLIVGDHAPFTQEARLAARQEITYRDALERIYSRRGAFATATPSSACVVDYGSQVIYRQNVLCYLSHGGRVVRVRSVLNPSQDFQLDTAPMAAVLSTNLLGTAEVQPEITLLHYSDWVVSLHVDYSETEPCADWSDDSGLHWLIYVELRKFDPATLAGVQLIKPAGGASKLFVRNTADYLVYGTHTGLGAHGHHEWKIHAQSLSSSSSANCPTLPPDMPALQLNELVGSDLGSTVAFEIHDGFFYAVSNQTSFVVEEVDWTSFYHCVRFPLAQPVKDAVQVNTRVYRRQHAEGPINDSWTDLGLQVDERTNTLQIVEARREWRNGGSKQERTFYTREITFPPRPISARHQRRGTTSSSPTGESEGGEEEEEEEEEAMVTSGMQSASPPPSASPSNATTTPEGGDGDGDIAASASAQSSSAAVADPPLPLDDLLVGTLSSGNNPHWAPAEERLPRDYHPERKHDDNQKAFILARTKLRAYNLSCSAFLDLVEDEACCPANAAVGSPPCLRLRIGARKRQPYLPLEVCDCVPVGEGKGKGRAAAMAMVGVGVGVQQLPPYEDRFVYPPIRLWPPCGEGDKNDDGDEEGRDRKLGCSKKLHEILNAPLTPPPPVVVPVSLATGAHEGGNLISPASMLSLGTVSTYTPPPPATEIVAAADERSVVFLRRPKYGSGERSGPIVLVSFDRGIDTEELAYHVGVRAVAAEAMAAATRKDSGISMTEASELVAGAASMKLVTRRKEEYGNGLLWTKDECWSKECACVRKRPCGVA